MQRVIRRTALVRNQAKRRARVAAKKERREENKDALRARFQVERVQLDLERDERLRRRDDWMRGPLAAKRDSGLEQGHYGALPSQVMQWPTVPTSRRKRYINIAPGDRVCLMKGRNKGKICEVTKVDSETETVTVADHNQVDVYLPQWLNEVYGGQRSYSAIGMSIPLDDVRLVVPLDDPATGSARDVLVEHVYGGGPFLDRQHGSSIPKHTRYIAGEDIEIPWPNEDLPTNLKDEPCDTLRMEVETPTWIPSLQNAPFESSILDELRNKYSKYRTRHDPEWVEAKKLEDYREEYLKNRTLLTPSAEFRAKIIAKKAEARKAMVDADGNYIMSDQTARFIAQFMQRTRNEGKASTE